MLLLPQRPNRPHASRQELVSYIMTPRNPVNDSGERSSVPTEHVPVGVGPLRMMMQDDRYGKKSPDSNFLPITSRCSNSPGAHSRSQPLEVHPECKRETLNEEQLLHRPGIEPGAGRRCQKWIF